MAIRNIGSTPLVGFLAADAVSDPRILSLSVAADGTRRRPRGMKWWPAYHRANTSIGCFTAPHHRILQRLRQSVWGRHS